MKVLLLGGSSSRNSGGVFDTARMMGLTLKKQNAVDVEYLMFNDEYSAEDNKKYAPLPVHSYTVSGPKKLGYSADLLTSLKSIHPDVVHTQSLWMYLSYANKKYHDATGTPYIISPHGMLDEWQLDQSFLKNLKKNIVLKLYERKHLESASCIHALCREEHDAIRAFGLKNPIAVIPNGVELPSLVETVQPTGSARKELLFLGRIHQKKGLENLLHAWKLTNPAQHDWQLVIAGETKDAAFMNLLTQTVKELAIEETVTFTGGQFGADKHTRLSRSHGFILPSFSEGLPMSVLEAWAYSLPAIITPFCNLPEGYTHGAAIQIDTSPKGISEGIRQLINMPADTRIEMGKRGRELATEKFTWSKVCDSMTKLYSWVLGKTAAPDFVSFN